MKAWYSIERLDGKWAIGARNPAGVCVILADGLEYDDAVQLARTQAAHLRLDAKVEVSP